MTNVQDDLFDILDGVDDFPQLKKISKESFSVNLDTLVESSQNSDVQEEDNFNVDEFLYKNFRFVSLQELNQELVELKSGLNDELFNLVNNDYKDFIELGQSINNDNFINLMTSIKLSILNYHKNISNQQKEIESDFSLLNNGIYYKKRLWILRNYLCNLQYLHKMLNLFEQEIKQNQEDDTNSVDNEKGSRFDVLVKSQLSQVKQLNVESVKELSSLYMSIHQLEGKLSKVGGDVSSATTNEAFLLEVPSIVDCNDVVDNVEKLNQVSIDGLLGETNPFAEEQFHRVNKVRFEFRAVLDEYAEKEDKSVDDLIELLGVYLILGNEEGFLKKMKERRADSGS